MSTAAYTNGYQPNQYVDFAGGLNLRDKADAVSDKEAIDLLNVDFADRGAIRQRDGYQRLGDSDTVLTDVSHLTTFFRTGSSDRQVVIGMDGTVIVLTRLGGSVSGQETAGGSWTSVATGQSLTAEERLWMANGTDPIWAWDGTFFIPGAAIATVNGTAGRAMPSGKIVLMTAALPGAVAANNAGNRMINTGFGSNAAGGPGGAATNPSRAWLSNMNAPTVWETDGFAGDALGGIKPRGNYHIDFTPGDGESIAAGATWRELVFFFKQTKFFVLWGEAIAPDTTSYFQVREVINNVGVAGHNTVAVGRDGVYFLNYRGVYLTSGGDPKLISDAITPMWTQDPDIYFESEPINLARMDLVRMWWHHERLYIAVPTGDRNYCDRTLVYDTQHQWWSLYDIPMAAITTYREEDGAGDALAFVTSERIAVMVPGSTLDGTSQMVSRWRSGFGDYNSPQQKTIRETKVWGRGAIYVGFSADFERDLHYAPEVIFGDPLLTEGMSTQAELVRHAVRGTVFSTQISNGWSAPTWAVQRVARHLREIREPSVR